MPLLLKQVEAARGARWLRDALRLFARRPLAFTVMFGAFMGAALVASLVPWIGGVLLMMMPPLVSLGFMVASQSALLDGPVTPAQFVTPLRGDPARRRSLLILCALYAAGAIAIILLCDAISGRAVERLWQISGSGTPAELQALLAEPGVSAAILTGTALGGLLSVPFWHAPALVYWGAQSVGQALFSSTLAVWRCKGAFLVYGLAWMALLFAFSMVSALVFALLGAGQLGSLFAVPAAAYFCTVFYVSLLFTFNDSFGGTESSA
jgi:hypothetical protein